MGSRARSLGSGSGGATNLVLYFYQDRWNVGVLSTTDKDFAERMKEWAESKGYRVEIR